MAHTAIMDEIRRKLEQMPLHLQQRVLDYVLTIEAKLPKGVSGPEMVERFAGKIPPEDLEEIRSAIEAGREQGD